MGAESAKQDKTSWSIYDGPLATARVQGPHKPIPTPHIRLNQFNMFELQANKLSSACVQRVVTFNKFQSNSLNGWWWGRGGFVWSQVYICRFQKTPLARLLTSAPIASANLPPRFRELLRALAEAVILCYIIVCYIISYHIISYYMMLHYIILYYIICYYIILHYIVLYYSTTWAALLVQCYLFNGDFYVFLRYST